MKLNESTGQNFERQKNLAASEALRAAFCPTQGFKKGTFNSSGFSAEGTFRYCIQTA